MLQRLLLILAIALTLALPSIAHARPEPVTWCGTDEVTANRVPDLGISSTAQIRMVYAVPSDATDNFFANASGIATDAAWIDQWWQREDGSRTARFDRYPFPGCGSQFGALDIGFVRLPQGRSYYAEAASHFQRLLQDLNGTLQPPESQKTVVYYDGPIADGNVCGQSSVSPTRGGSSGFALLYLLSNCQLFPPGSGPSADTAAHELLHSLGAAPSGAPHTCQFSPGHVCDSEADVLSPYYTPGLHLDLELLDVNRDDYYAHPGPQWDVQDSLWLAHLPQYPVTFSVPEGHGALIVAIGRNQIPCDNGCQVQVDNGTSVSIVSRPADGYLFGSWSGGCGALLPTCSLTVDGPKTITATFVPEPATISVRATGRGSVRSTPAGISCPSRCTWSFPAGTGVRLTATPARGWRFTAWGGACKGSRPCRISADRDRSVVARFARR